MYDTADNWPDLGLEKATSDHRTIRAALGAVAERGVDYVCDRFVACPWPATTGTVALRVRNSARPLYTPEERMRRDQTPWTMVQAVLAPVQFAIFLVSLCLVVNYLASGQGYQIATASIVLKTLALYTIMVTGAIWENKVFGRYLFAESFFWEDAFSMLVIALHTGYLLALMAGWGSVHDRMILALAAYASYAVNATQFILKLRKARLEAGK